MPPGQSWFDKILLRPDPATQPVGGPPLPPNPGLSQLVDLVGGATGLKDALNPKSSNATMLGALGASLIPLASMLKLGSEVPAARSAVTAALKAPAVVAAERSAPAVIIPKPRGSLAATLERQAPGGVYTIRPDVQERMFNFYQRGQGVPSNWEGSNQELLEAFGGDVEAARQWARMWGATSPNTSAPRNTAESISAHLWKLEHPGQELTNAEAKLLSPKITMARSKVPNINNAIAGRPLSGDKVEAMAGFMVGEPRLPVDVHVLYGVGSKNEKLAEDIPALRALMKRLEDRPSRGPEALTKTAIYLRYEDALRRSLQEFNPKQGFNTLFGQTWEGIRSAKGLAHQGGPIDVLRMKGLLEPGAMLDPQRLKDVLQTKGWKAPAITALLSAIYLGDPRPHDLAAPTGTPATTGLIPLSRSGGTLPDSSRLVGR